MICNEVLNNLLTLAHLAANRVIPFRLLQRIDPCDIRWKTKQYNLSPLGNAIYCNAKIYFIVVFQHDVCRSCLLLKRSLHP